MKKFMNFTCIVLLSVFLTACTIFSSPTASAKDWFEAFNKLDVLVVDNLTCKAEQDYMRATMESITPYLSIFAPSWENSGVELDATGIAFDLLDKESDYAIVNVSGEMKRVVAGTLVVKNVDENLFMKKGDDTWVWCGFTDLEIIDLDTIQQNETVEENQLCPQEKYSPYYNSALYSFEKFRSVGYIPGKMLDPLAIDNPETRLLTGFIPGWFCVPERKDVCEKMLGISLKDFSTDSPNSGAGAFESFARRYKQEHYFEEIRRNWDKEWLPYLLKNPTIPSTVKDFYRIENRLNVCTQFVEDNPLPSP
jgi:hypothetical protein